MPQNKKDFRVAEPQEIRQLLSDLKNILESLSTVVIRLERDLNKYEAVSDEEDGFQSAEEEIKEDSASVLKRVHSFQKQSKQMERNIKRVPSKKFSATNPPHVPQITIVKQKSVTTEAVNQTVVNAIEESNSRTFNVKTMKKKFELTNETNHDNSDEDSIITNEVLARTHKVNVNVQNLKQRFEPEKSEITVASKTKFEERRRTSEEKNRNEGLTMTDEYNEKVKKILKYFRPHLK